MTRMKIRTPMQRRNRLNLTDVPQHVIQRCNSRQATFLAEEDYRFYLDCLVDAARRYDCHVANPNLVASQVKGSGHAPGDFPLPCINTIQPQGKYRRIARQQRQLFIPCLCNQKAVERIGVRTVQAAHGFDMARQDRQHDEALRFELLDQ